jgi:DNA-binding NtrC family response regulator
MSERVRTVLVVDADPCAAQAAIAALPGEGYRVVHAADGGQALAALAGRGFDVLVSEIVLPDGSGLRLLAEARRLHPGVARIALTAVADFPAAVAAINEAEVFRFLGKPVAAIALRNAIDEAAERADAVREASGGGPPDERRRIALVGLESDHPGISLVPSGPDGYFIPRQRLQGIVERLRGSPVGRLLDDAIAASRDEPA